MPRIDIKTVLGFCPPEKKHEILFITRGASASILYNLYDKVYDMDNIDQLTFIFKQGKKLFSYKLVDYFIITKDLEVDSDKKYYRKAEESLESGNDFIEISTIDGGLIEAYRRKYGDIYEVTDIASGEANPNWQFNKHFSYNHGDGYSYITFMLSPEETLLFKPTCKENEVLFETATMLNTDAMEGMHGSDSIIITPQHRIAVVDSLYSRIINNDVAPVETNVAIVSEKTFCADNLYCKN